MYELFLPSVLFALSLSSPLPRQGGYVAESYLPAITGSASAPVTIPIVRDSGMPAEPNSPPPPPTTFTFTLTGKDMDKWKHVPDGTFTEFADADIIAAKGVEEYATTSGPNFRGTAADGTATWDIVGPAHVVGFGVHMNTSATYINRYVIGNNTLVNGRSPLLNDPSLQVYQTLIRPAY